MSRTFSLIVYFEINLFYCVSLNYLLPVLTNNKVLCDRTIFIICLDGRDYLNFHIYIVQLQNFDININNYINFVINSHNDVISCSIRIQKFLFKFFSRSNPVSQ